MERGGWLRMQGMAKEKGSKPVPFGDERERVVKRVNKWRESYNPLRGLTIARAAGLMESYTRGDFTDLMWAYRAAEQADETLFALVERRIAAIEAMDWTVKTVTKQTPGFDPVLAEEQRSALWGRYQAMPNLYECLAHLALSAFRGFSMLGKVNGGLEPVDHWNVVRDGLRRRWKYNPEAESVSFHALPASHELALEDLVVMESPRGHVDRLGLVKHLRSALGMKDWTAFIEIYAVPSGIVIMPNSIPAGQEAAYVSAAEKAAAGMPAALPAGSSYIANDAPRGVDPFSRFLERLDQQIVLAGTGGMLTMLTQAGSGTLAGGAHSEAFKQIAKGHARRISEALQQQFDLEVLQEAFSGKPVLAYFTLEFSAETDTTQVVDDAVKLAAAGWRMDAEDLSEKTGYRLKNAPADRGAPAAHGSAIEEVLAIRNRLVALRRLVVNGEAAGHECRGNGAKGGIPEGAVPMQPKVF